MSSDTIFALASGRLPAGIAVIRLSGPRVRFGLETICGVVPTAREMKLVRFVDVSDGLIDCGLVVFFDGPHSFTGEDCAELHLHGGIAVVRSMLGYLSQLVGFRAADAGEFTKRAFLSGKIDLTQSEALADLVSAETEAQRRLAVTQADGQLRSLYESWRSRLLLSRAMIEAAIDFSDEDDVASRALITLFRDMSVLRDELVAHVSGYRTGEIIRDGFQVVIIGAPNSGKSSLLNALVKRDVAIASDEAGTTRDLIDVNLEIRGNLVVLTDTAGLREAQCKVEAIGVMRARARIETADLVLHVSNIHEPTDIAFDAGGVDVLAVGTHLDLGAGDSDAYDVALSSKSGEGVEYLLQMLGQRASDAIGSAGAIPVRERQVSLVSGARLDLEALLLLSADDMELIAEHLRSATVSIGRLVGDVDVEDLLDVIFSQFCIGK